MKLGMLCDSRFADPRPPPPHKCNMFLFFALSSHVKIQKGEVLVSGFLLDQNFQQQKNKSKSLTTIQNAEKSPKRVKVLIS